MQQRGEGADAKDVRRRSGRTGRRSRSLAAFALAAAAALASAITGCIVSERPPPSRAYVVTVPPPPPLVDDRIPSPTGSSVWVTGYWHWMGVRYAWIPGHWEEPPPGARWAAPRYSVREGAYTYEPGRWQPAAPAPPTR
jgi:hypothetical protein